MTGAWVVLEVVEMMGVSELDVVEGSGVAEELGVVEDSCVVEEIGVSEAGVVEGSWVAEELGVSEDSGVVDESGVTEELGVCEELGVIEDSTTIEVSDGVEDSGVVEKPGVVNGSVYTEELGVVGVSRSREELGAAEDSGVGVTSEDGGLGLHLFFASPGVRMLNTPSKWRNARECIMNCGCWLQRNDFGDGMNDREDRKMAGIWARLTEVKKPKQNRPTSIQERGFWIFMQGNYTMQSIDATERLLEI
uniref:Uncharacterized protein n=1 Tax=Bionectria ochroleuca TaxID=29856 RepID=A0A8H7NGF9_BIOOC